MSILMNSLTFRLLEVFQQIVDSGSVTAASKALSLSQPTVSLQLKKLTSIVGIPLVEQSYGQLKMTEAGEAVYQCAQEVLGSQSRLNSQVKAMQGVEIGTLKLAVVTTAKYIIPPILSPFCQQHPNIDVRFTVGNRETIIARLKQNKDDLYIFSHPPKDHDLQLSPFMPNRLVVIAPRDYEGPEKCHLNELCSQKFLLRESGSGTRKAVDEYCEAHGITLTTPMVIQSNEAIRLGVASGLGLAILSEHTLEHTPMSNIRILNIIDFPLVTHWQAVSAKHRQMSPATVAFKQALLNMETS